MLATQSVIDSLAERIERAYRRRRPGWRGGCSTPRVWVVVAETLCRARELNSSLPLDPELFVLAQPGASPYADPWVELTRAAAVENYAKRIRTIVADLRGELAREIRHAEGQIARSRSVAQVLRARDRKLSSLGRYLVGVRAGNPALAARFLRGALRQHHACPLYQQAALAFVAAELYPTTLARGADEPPGRRMEPAAGCRSPLFPSN